MNTNIKIELTDEQRKLFKTVFGIPGTRKNVKAVVLKLFTAGLYPDGAPVVKKKKFVLAKKG